MGSKTKLAVKTITQQERATFSPQGWEELIPKSVLFPAIAEARINSKISK